MCINVNLWATSQMPLEPAKLEVENTRMSYKPRYVEVSKGYLFNHNGKKVFARLYAMPCTDWKKLVIYQGYDFTLNWNKWSMAKEAFQVEISGTDKWLSIETRLPMNQNYYQSFGDIAQVIANNVGFKF